MLVFLLLGVELLDELYSGVPSLASPDVQSAFGATYATTAGALLLVPGLVAMVVEPVLFVLADRYPKRWFVCGGLVAMGLAAFAAATAPSLWMLSAAIGVAWIGSGAGVALAQAALVDARPDHPERALARWALLGEIGDLAAPVLMAGLAAAGLGWRVGYVVVGTLVLVWAALLVRAPAPRPTIEDDDEEPPITAAIREALGNRRLLFWLGATALCDLLDEIVVVFAALHLRDHLSASPTERSLVFGAAVVGAIAGAMATERLLARVPPIRLLLAASVVCALAYAAWLFAPTVWISAGLFALVGLTAAPMYPIASAQAYAALPGRSGTVNAAGHLFTPLMLALPFALGWIADAAGLELALAILMAQPLGLIAVALWTGRNPRR